MTIPRPPLGPFLLLFLLLLSQRATAQTFEDTPRSVYVGLQVGAHRYLIDYPSGYNEITTGPVHLQVGYQISPRLALQVGGSYRHEQYAGGVPSPTTGLLAGREESHTRTTDIPLLARYTPTRKPANRFKLDLVGGVSIVHSQYRYDKTITEDGVVTLAINRNEKLTDPYLTAGLGMRYGLSRKLAATFDARLNKLTHEVQTIPGLSRPISFFSVGLGLRYTFR